MMVAARGSVMIPAFTNPMTMTVMAPELWIAAVPTVPIPTPYHLLFEALVNMLLSLPLLMDSKLELSILHAVRKTPIPAMRVRIAVIINMSSKRPGPRVVKPTALRNSSSLS